jgi:hypothetical protein
MQILNLYYSQTGNTEKIARTIAATLQALGHSADTVVAAKGLIVDLPAYDFVFAGSGVYQWLPGKPMLDFLRGSRQRFSEAGRIQPCSPRLADKRAVMYCTYGGAHTGIREAIPAVKFCGQLFDHLGFAIIDEWYFIGDFKTDELRQYNTCGLLGDISGRPDPRDLQEVARRVQAIFTGI